MPDTIHVRIWSRFADDAWEGDVPAPRSPRGDETTEPMYLLEHVFRYFNRVDHEDVQRMARAGYYLPSLSMGDEVTLDGVTYRCASLGWEQA